MLVQCQGFSVSHAALPAHRLRVHKKSGGDTAGAVPDQAGTDPNWPKAYSVPYSTVLSNKSWDKEGGRGDIQSYGIWLPKSQLGMAEPCFPGIGWTPACPWEVVKEFLLLPCLHIELLLYLLNCLYLKPRVFSVLVFLFSPPFLRGERVGGWMGLSCPTGLTHNNFANSSSVFFIFSRVWRGSYSFL